VLSARTKLIEQEFGQDSLIRYHRFLGRLALVLLLLHPIFVFINEGTVTIGSGTLTVGTLVLLALTLTAFVASHYKKLKLPYELWLNIHKVNYVLFPLVLLFHVFINARPATLLYFIWVVLGILFIILLLNKTLRERHIRNYPYEVVKVKQEAKDICSLYFKGRPLSYKPGQFMYLRLMRNGKKSSSHPFTISSSPTSELLAVTPKEQGDFTSTVKETKKGDLAYIDAPYGVFSFLNYDSGSIVFIAGGIGITPFMSMLRYMYDKKTDKPVTLLWGNKDKESLCFEDELATMEKELKQLQVVYVMSRQDSWHGEKGRIGREIIEKYLPEPAVCEFYICGPPPMSRAAIDALHEMGIPKKKIHHELFEF
jgi:predicted ferric reductase